jgi:MFS family permease
MLPLRCWIGLNSLNFFVAAVQTGFGPFFTVYLTEQRWRQVDIGIALSVGTAAALACQLPAGMLVDGIHHKRFAIGIGLILLLLSVLVLLVAPTPGPIWTAQVVHAIASCILTPAIAALTLALCGQADFAERIGINARYQSLGSATAAALLGAIAWYLSERAVFVTVALLVMPAIAMLPMFRSSDRVPATEHPSLLHPRERKERDHRAWHVFSDPVLHIFAASTLLFHLANAAMLPLALNELAKRSGHSSGFVVSAAILVPQVLVALGSPWGGRLAERIGRKPILLAGFAALPLRAILFASLPDAVPLVAFQALDGVSALVFGLMVPLIAADLTHRNGFLNLAMSAIMLAAGLGATVSTTVAGWLADTLGAPVAFLSLALSGLAALLVVWTLMPETRPTKPIGSTPMPVAA